MAGLDDLSNLLNSDYSLGATTNPNIQSLFSGLGNTNNIQSLISARGGLNNQLSPEEVQAQQYGKMAGLFEGDKSFGGNLIKGFLTGTAASNMSKAAQKRQTQNDILQQQLDYQIQSAQHADQLHQIAATRQQAFNDMVNIMPQVAQARQDVEQTKDPTALANLIKTSPAAMDVISQAENAPQNGKFATFTAVGDGPAMTLHAVYNMPDGSTFVAPQGITLQELDAHLITPAANLRDANKFAMAGKVADLQLKEAQTGKAMADTQEASTKAKMQGMFLPQEGQASSTTPQATQPSADGRNEAYLQSISPAAASMVKGYADYKMKLTPRALAGYDGQPTPLAMAIMQYDPNFDMTNYEARQKLRNDYTAGKTKDNLVALNTAMSHIDTMGQMAQGLQNGSITPVNYVKNLAAQLTGKEAPQDFQTAKTAVASELGKYFRGTGMSDHSAMEWEKAFISSNSPQQMAGVVKTAINLIAGRANELQDVWHNGMGEGAKDYPIINQHAADVLKKNGYVYQNGRIWTDPKAAAPAAADSITQKLSAKGFTPEQIAEYRKMKGL